MLTACCASLPYFLSRRSQGDQLIVVSVGEPRIEYFTHLLLAIDLGSSVSSVHSDSKSPSVTKFLFRMYWHGIKSTALKCAEALGTSGYVCKMKFNFAAEWRDHSLSFSRKHNAERNAKYSALWLVCCTLWRILQLVMTVLGKLRPPKSYRC